MSKKKKMQLGMNPSTASGRLVKDILWSLITETNKNICYKCNEVMCRKTFSVEHKEPWLDSLDPLKLYFDLDNIAFTHLRCNIKDSRRRPPSKCGTPTQYNKYGCRCEPCKKAKVIERAKNYTPEKKKSTIRSNRKMI